MDLSHCKMRMLEMEFFRAPAIGEMIQHEFNDFHSRACDQRHACLIKDNMFVARFA